MCQDQLGGQNPRSKIKCLAEDKRVGPELESPASPEGPENTSSPSEETWWLPQEGVFMRAQSQRGPKDLLTGLTWTEEVGSRDWSLAGLIRARI